MYDESFCPHCDGEGSTAIHDSYFRNRCPECGGSGDRRDKWPLDPDELHAEMDRRQRNFQAILPILPMIVMAAVLDTKG